MDEMGDLRFRARLRFPLVKAIGQDQTAFVFIQPRKLGFSASVSPRALIRRLPMAGSLAQEGIRPQTKKSAVFLPSLGIARTGCVGAML